MGQEQVTGQHLVCGNGHKGGVDSRKVLLGRRARRQEANIRRQSRSRERVRQEWERGGAGRGAASYGGCQAQEGGKVCNGTAKDQSQRA